MLDILSRSVNIGYSIHRISYRKCAYDVVYDIVCLYYDDIVCQPTISYCQHTICEGTKIPDGEPWHYLALPRSPIRRRTPRRRTPPTSRPPRLRPQRRRPPRRRPRAKEESARWQINLVALDERCAVVCRTRTAMQFPAENHLQPEQDNLTNL